jgi:cytochrome c oxidase subunit IV
MLDHAQGIKVVYKGLAILAAVTILEVFIALLANGHLIEGMHWSKLIYVPLMIGMSLFKAYFIVYEFMHMKYEVKGLAMTIVLPMLLLVWGVIAFMQEGGAWKARRQKIKEFNKVEVAPAQPTGYVPSTTKML